MGGLFKGAFGVPSSEGAAQDVQLPTQSQAAVTTTTAVPLPEDEPRESDSSGMSGQPGAECPTVSRLGRQTKTWMELSEEPSRV